MWRIISAAVLAPITWGAAYVGGWPFALFWALAAVAVLWEWIALVTRANRRLTFSSCVWIVSGISYAGVMAIAPILLRADQDYGMPALMLLLAVVWTTDIAAYFGGRIFGGPKLCPPISPKKTWSGAISGTVGAVIVGVAIIGFFGSFNGVVVAVISLFLSAMAQLGDLLESAIKRRFGTKDASRLIPGHGGFMDRLDSFWAAALAACVLGIARGGFDGAARGLLVW
jgi:phosphatidate cytidylyltransferase